MAMRLRLPEDLRDTLLAQAENEGRSIQLVVQDAVQEYIDHRSDLVEIDEALRVLIPRCHRMPDRLGNA